MTKTTAELASKVLERLRVIGIGDTPSPARSHAVISYYTDTFQELEDDDIGFWEETAIPERVFTALVDFIAGRMAASFGLMRPDLEAGGLIRLRQLSAESYSGSLLKTTYY